MIKEFKDISQKDLEYFKTHKVVITEMLDLIPFNVVVSDDIKIYNPKGKEISDVDKIVNTVYQDIDNFVYNNISSMFYELKSMFGNDTELKMCFLYKPVDKTCVIEYPNLPFNFILRAFYVGKKESDAKQLLNRLNGVSGAPIIKTLDCLKYNDEDNIIDILEGKTWSNNNINNIEGFILSSGKLKYKVSIVDTNPNIEKSTKKIYRDTLLENFVKVVDDIDANYIYDSNKTYIEKTCDLFLEYINKTDILSVAYIEPEDLLPPYAGYKGDINLNNLPYMVQMICKNNELYKNILKILLITFNIMSSDNKFNSFSDITKNKLIEIKNRLN